MTWSQTTDGNGNTVYVNSATGEQTSDPSGLQAQQAITPENLNTAYKSMFGTDAPQDWINNVTKSYDPASNSLSQVISDMATSAATSGTPFANTPGDQGGFTGGAQYYESQGYVPGSTTYEGVPTSFIDPKTGQVVASYGTVGEGSTPGSSIQSGNWTWNQAATTPAGYTTDLAEAKTDTNSFQDFLKTGALVAAAVAAPELLGTLAPEAIGAGALGSAEAFPVTGGALLPGTELGAIGAGDAGAALTAGGDAIGAGSLTEGLTPDMIAAQEAALPQTMSDIGGLSGTLTDAQAAALMGQNLLPAELQIPAASAGLTAADALKYAKLGLGTVGALSSVLGGSKAGTGTGANAIPSGGTSGGALPGNLQTSALQTGQAQTTDPFANLDKYQQFVFTDSLAPVSQSRVSAKTGGSIHDLSVIEHVHPKLLKLLGGGVAKAKFYTYGDSSSPLTPTGFAGNREQQEQIVPTQFTSNRAALPAPGNPNFPVKGQQPTISPNASQIQRAMALLSGASLAPQEPFAKGGEAEHIPEFITGATGHYVKGRGDGQSDDIPAMLADGEYVFDAETVAQLGNGSSDAGAKVLDKMREALRHHKRSAPVDSIPPKAKSPLEYLKEGMKRK